jgi:hypothetical protein
VRDVAEDLGPPSLRPFAEVDQRAAFQQHLTRSDELLNPINRRLAATGPHDHSFREKQRPQYADPLGTPLARGEGSEERIHHPLDLSTVGGSGGVGGVHGGGVGHPPIVDVRLAGIVRVS